MGQKSGPVKEPAAGCDIGRAKSMPATGSTSTGRPRAIGWVRRSGCCDQRGEHGPVLRPFVAAGE